MCVCVGWGVLWVPRVPGLFPYQSLYIYGYHGYQGYFFTNLSINGYQVSMCMWRAMVNFGYHGYQHIFVLNLQPNECVCGGCVYYGYHGYQRVFVLNLYISAVLSRVPTGTKSLCVCAGPWQSMGTTGTNTFLY